MRPSTGSSTAKPSKKEENFGTGGDDAADLNPCSYILYYALLFFAYWFGSARFDMDGDGDFDPEDVQAFLEQKGFLSSNFKKKPRNSRTSVRKSQSSVSGRPSTASESVAEGSAAAGSQQGSADSSRRASSEVASAAAVSVDVAEATEGATEGKTPAPPSGGGGLFSAAFDLDHNGDGKVDFRDMLETDVVDKHGNRRMSQESEMAEKMTDLTTAQGKPWYMIFQCIAAFGLWAVNAYRKSMEEGTEALSLKAGLDTFNDGYFDLKLFDLDCNDLRSQVWRWLSYQYTHIGVMHVTMNCFLNCMLGIPLEGVHGPWRMFIMFNVGVIGGACCMFVNNPFNTVVGMSGGCYALIGMHFADLIMNWHQKKFRKPTLIFITCLAGADITSYMLTMSSENASHSAHLGGAIAGLIIGVMIGENMEVHTHERVIQGVLTLVGLGLTAFCIAWNFTTWPPTDIWGSTGYCWYRQVWQAGRNMTEWQCARCGGQDCIFQYTNPEIMPPWEVRPVSYSVCNDQGWDYDTGL